jgi:multidrug resistance efflux pump
MKGDGLAPEIPMKRARVAVLAVLVLAAAGVVYYVLSARSSALVLTGIVTTNDRIVSPQIAGQIARLLVREGDRVAPDQLLAVMAPQELRTDTQYYAHSAAGATSQVAQAETQLRLQRQQSRDAIRQAEANLAAAEAQRAEAASQLEMARLDLDRNAGLVKEKIVTQQQYDQSRTAYDTAVAHLDAVGRQVDAQRAALALARADAEQVAVRESQLRSNEQQLAAAKAQQQKADVRLGYTELRAPIGGIVDVVAARAGEVVNPGQAVLTLVDPDDLWVRADVEESYIDRIRLGDTMTVRLPSGAERQGTVFYRGVDASYATQRDVSRTKRDIKTFQIRLRVDNRDRRLAVGMTAYVLLRVR